MTPETKATLVKAMRAEAWSIYDAGYKALLLAGLYTASVRAAWELAKQQDRDLRRKAAEIEAGK